MSTESILLIIVGWLAILMMGDQAVHYIGAIKDYVNSFVRSAEGLISEGDAKVDESFEKARDGLNEFCQAVGLFLTESGISIRDFARASASQTRGLLHSLFGKFTNDSAEVVWMIYGSVFYLAAIIFFVYADSAQIANSLSLIYPEAPQPEFLGDLILPSIVASGGTALMLATIVGDLVGQTHFSPWSKTTGVVRTFLAGLVAVTIVLAIVFSVMIALVRYPEAYSGLEAPSSRSVEDSAANGPTSAEALVTPAPAFQLGAKSQIDKWASIGHVGIILPLFLTTGLLLWGATGLVPLMAAPIFLLAALLILVSFFLRLLGVVVEKLGSVSALALWVFKMALRLFTFVTFGVAELLRGVLLIALTFVQMIVSMLQQPYRNVLEYAKRFDSVRDRFRLGPPPPGDQAG